MFNRKQKKIDALEAEVSMLRQVSDDLAFTMPQVLSRLNHVLSDFESFTCKVNIEIARDLSFGLMSREIDWHRLADRARIEG